MCSNFYQTLLLFFEIIIWIFFYILLVKCSLHTLTNLSFTGSRDLSLGKDNINHWNSGKFAR